MDRDLLTIDEVCRKLKVTRQWFARDGNKKKLKALGFPEPVPGMGKRWDPRAIDFYLDQFLPAHLRQQNGRDPIADRALGMLVADPDKLSHAQRTLQQRLRAMSGANA